MAQKTSRDHTGLDASTAFSHKYHTDPISKLVQVSTCFTDCDHNKTQAKAKYFSQTKILASSAKKGRGLLHHFHRSCDIW